ncbi:MAG TPA: ComF family protein [Pirellulaceae bacterium]|nr:ComF family protein [Pirellulaceae bacterium]HMO92745.1 ComF family protein [Pirellulaceae bacterium]HMP70297.1 ComF family protein [Pirellulaceae bacterium]
MEYNSSDTSVNLNRENFAISVREISFTAFRDLLFPNRCVICGSETCLVDDLQICKGCQGGFLREFDSACSRCGASKPNALEYYRDRADCPKCRGAKFLFNRAVSLGDYTGILRKVVIEMKHQQREALSIQMGRLLGMHVLKIFGPNAFNRVVCVPTHFLRRLVRGSSVAELLAEGVASKLKLPFNANVIGQIRATKKQGTLTKSERGKNVRDAFQVRRTRHVENQRLLLVDDVMTSGSTVNEVARVLNKAGVASVVVCTVARSVNTQ